jgi:hypothetical protein
VAEPLARHLGEVREEIEKLSGDGPTGVHPVVVPTIVAPDRFEIVSKDTKGTKKDKAVLRELRVLRGSRQL